MIQLLQAQSCLGKLFKSREERYQMSVCMWCVCVCVYICDFS